MMPDQAGSSDGPASGDGRARFAFVGSFTRHRSRAEVAATPFGTSVFAVDAGSGALSLAQTVSGDNPSFLALHPTRPFLYAVSEVHDFGGGRSGSVEAFAIDPATGELSLLNRQGSAGAGPTHLAVDPTGGFVVVANYVGATFAVLPIRDDGRLDPVSDVVEQTGTGPNAERQEAPHPHGVAFAPTGGFVATADLGIDKVQLFRLNTAAGTLEATSEASTAPGAGPRHLSFSRDGRYLYVINELDATVTVFAYDAASGRVGSTIQTVSTVPDGFVGTRSTAEIAVHPTGRFLYGSNRGQPDAASPVADSIVGYAIDQTTGALSPIGYATDGIVNPRNFAIDPTGAWLYACNQQADTIVQFAVDQATGALTPTGQVTETPTPVCIVFI